MITDEGFHAESEFQINDESIPTYTIKLTAEQSKLVEYTELDFLRIDGRTMFKVKNKAGEETGEYVMFVIFKK